MNIYVCVYVYICIYICLFMYVVINVCIERIAYTVYRRKENAHVLCGIAVLSTGGCIISSTTHTQLAFLYLASDS